MLIPLHCEYFALEGLADLVGTMRRVRAALNPALDIEGVLLTMFDERTNLGQQVANDVRGFFKEKVFRTVIPRNVRLGEAPSHGMPVMLYDVKSRGAEAYLALAREVLERAAAPAASMHDATQAAKPAKNASALRAWRASRSDVITHGKTPALGKGLSALIPDAPEPPRRRRSTSTSIGSRRTTFSRAAHVDDARLEDLAQSIRANGIIQPIVVRKVGDRFQIIAGERRWRAAEAPASLRVPVVVRDVAPARSDRCSRWRSSRTSSARTSNPIDEALAYRRLADEFHLTQDDIAAAVGKDRATVANVLRLLKLPDEVRDRSRVGTAVDGPRARAAVAAGRSRSAPPRARRHRAQSVGARNRVAGQEARRERRAAAREPRRRRRSTSTPARPRTG